VRATIFTFCLLVSAHAALATDIGVVGLFPGKAVLVVNDSTPKTYSVGATVTEGIKLISANESSATLDVNGKRQTIAIGQHVSRSVANGSVSVTLQADGQGHFVTQGQINGGSMRMLVDTGATMVSLSAADARRLGIDYKKGRVAYSSTANGAIPVYVVRLNSVKVGDIELDQVDAAVQETGMPFGLLGMTFLNRTEMQRNGDQMTLTKRY